MFTSMLCVLAAALPAAEAPPPFPAAYDAGRTLTPATSPRAARRLATPRGVRWIAPGRTKPYRGAPDPARIAAHYLGALAGQLGLPRPATEAAHVRLVGDTGRGGIIVQLGQRQDGRPVRFVRLALLLARDMRLLAVSGRLHPAAAPRSPPGRRRFPADGSPRALARALGDVVGMAVTTRDLTATPPPTSGSWRRFALSAGGRLALGRPRLWLPPRVREIYYPFGPRLLPAYEVETFVTTAEGRQHAFRHIVGSAGRLLQRRSLTAHESYRYRVWADDAYLDVPLDAPTPGYSPHPTGLPDDQLPPLEPSTLIDMEGFNTPPGGVADPWLPPGATELLGNNVEPWVDIVGDGSRDASDLRVPISAPGEFDYTYDFAASPFVGSAQLFAPAVSAFYCINWLHDFFYDSGFDEAAGNAQTDNYGRGGENGDPVRLRIEGKPHGFENNASMTTPADGSPPTMRTGWWDGSTARWVEALGGTHEADIAEFGPQGFDVTGNVVLGDDGTGPDVHDGCESLDASALTGNIALLYRGNCSYTIKVQHAEEAGAIAALIANHTAGQGAPTMTQSNPLRFPGIPALSTIFELGQDLEAALQAGPEQVRLVRQVPVQGAFDNTVIAHEWGHYIHSRLMNCDTELCGAMGEGWGDFLGAWIILRPGDDRAGAYVHGGYSASQRTQSPGYYGTRRVAYTTDFTQNALTFRHIADGEPLPTTHPVGPGPASNSEVHNAGEIWATMLWEAYIALLDDGIDRARFDFSGGQRRFADYIVGGMQLAPAHATFTEQRDALLAAARAADPADATAMGAAFARRGIGACAVDPPRFSVTFVGVVESFEDAGRLVISDVVLDDSVASCDDDGVLDPGEFGLLRVTVSNTGFRPVTTGLLSLASADLEALDGTSQPLPRLELGESAALTFRVRLAPGFDRDYVDASITASSTEACEGGTTQRLVTWVDVDETPQSSSEDGFEARLGAWTPGAENFPIYGHWTRERDDSGGAPEHYWHGPDNGFTSNIWLESPPLSVSLDNPLVFEIRHRFDFEYSDDTAWDGGVIEISRDGGANWEDLFRYGDTKYTHVISNQNRALDSRPAYGAQSSGWPAFQTQIISVGAQLAGELILLRFRVGTDSSKGETGWDIAHVQVHGLDNTPFPGRAPDAAACAALIADAGPDARHAPGAEVALDGSGSVDARGLPLTFTWEQIAGDPVTLDDPNAVTPRFVAPSRNTTLRFRLRVDNGLDSATDEVEIRVGNPRKGCGCQTPLGPTDGPLALLFLAGLLGWLRRRATSA